MLNLEYAAMTSTRRALVFESKPHESAGERRTDALEARKLIQQAACLSVRAGRPDVANDALTLLAKLEAGQ